MMASRLKLTHRGANIVVLLVRMKIAARLSELVTGVRAMSGVTKPTSEGVHQHKRRCPERMRVYSLIDTWFAPMHEKVSRGSMTPAEAVAASARAAATKEVFMLDGGTDKLESERVRKIRGGEECGERVRWAAEWLVLCRPLNSPVCSGCALCAVDLRRSMSWTDPEKALYHLKGQGSVGFEASTTFSALAS